MSRIEHFSSRRTPVRAALLDLADRMASEPSPEEAEFIEALRRIVARTPAEELWDKWRNSRSDARGRAIARYAD